MKLKNERRESGIEVEKAKPPTVELAQRAARGVSENYRFLPVSRCSSQNKIRRIRGLRSRRRATPEMRFAARRCAPPVDACLPHASWCIIKSELNDQSHEVFTPGLLDLLARRAPRTQRKIINRGLRGYRGSEKNRIDSLHPSHPRNPRLNLAFSSRTRRHFGSAA